MPQFLVTLYDGTDAEAPARRQATRPAHLDGLKGNVAAGKLVFGGPIFDDGTDSRSVRSCWRSARIAPNWMR